MANDSLIPPIGFGTWRLNGNEARTAIQAAVGCGYRLIDTAASYGNEVTIKNTLRDCGTKREDLFISGKLWNTKRRYDDAILACKQSLRRLGLEYFDLYLVHWPASPALYDNWRGINAECWRAMETLKRDGIAKAIGVCNFLPHHLDELTGSAAIMPAVDQIELHPGFLNTGIIRYCQKQSILIEAWSPLGEGALLQNDIIAGAAKKHGKTPAQICLRWCIQHGAVPLPRSAEPEHIRLNFDVFGFELDEEDMIMIDNMPFSGGAGLDPDTITIYG